MDIFFKNKEYLFIENYSFLYYINNQKIKVADIGGSLGSMYFQYKEILEKKQKHFVGKYSSKKTR